MKRCSVRPYNGDKKYIFISLSLKDKRYVYPIIEQLTKDGYRIWYDEGLSSGISATNEIALKIDQCSLFIAFVTENSLDSCQFKKEFNFAILKKKRIITVMLEELFLSPGIEMQLTGCPVIYKYKLEAASFYKALYAFDEIKECLGSPISSIIVSDENEYVETLSDVYGIDDCLHPPIDDALFVRDNIADGKAGVPRAVLIKLTTNEEIKITIPKMVIGRAVSKKNKPIVDYSIESNSMISRIHAVILYKNREYYLVDCAAVNKSYVNNDELKINEEYLLHDGDLIKLANEKFRFRRLEV